MVALHRGGHSAATDLPPFDSTTPEILALDVVLLKGGRSFAAQESAADLYPGQ
jgi:hypothetical protein